MTKRIARGAQSEDEDVRQLLLFSLGKHRSGLGHASGSDDMSCSGTDDRRKQGHKVHIC